MTGRARIAADVLQRSGLGPLLRRLPRRWPGVLVLNYHRILPAPGPRYDAGVWSATAEQFAAQLDLLEREHEVVPASEVGHHRERRGRRVAITFDDGYRDVHEIAWPLLRERGMPATVFVSSGLLDGLVAPWWDELAWLNGTARASREGLPPAPAHDWTALPVYGELDPASVETLLDRLSAEHGRPRLAPADTAGEWLRWDDVRDLHAGGIEIGAHTETHPVLSTLDADRQRAEVERSIERIADELGARPRLFAYPVGGRDCFDETSRRVVREAGIELAFSFYGGFGRRRAWDPFDVPRVSVCRDHETALFRALMTMPGTFGGRG